MKRILVLVSGMDSLVALHEARRKFPHDEVIGVYYDMGQPFSEAEKLKLPLDVVIRVFRGYLDVLEQQEIEGYVYYPDLFEGMLYDAIRTYRPDVLWLGVIATDSQLFRDNTIGWIDSFSSKFPHIEIDYPLARMGLGKKGVVEYGLKIGVQAEEMINMHHCRSKLFGDHGCGSCFSCMRKKSVFEELGYKTKIPNPKKIPTNLLAAQMEMYVENQDNRFDYITEALPLIKKVYEQEDLKILAKEIRHYYKQNDDIVEWLLEDLEDA